MIDVHYAGITHRPPLETLVEYMDARPKPQNGGEDND